MLKRSILILSLIIPLAGGCATQNGLTKKDDPNAMYKKALSYYYKQKYDKSIEIFKDIVNNHPFSERAIDAELFIADSYYYNEEYEDAYSYYSNFATLHPTHPKAPYALFQKGMSAFNQILAIDRDQESTKKALQAFEELVNLYPTNSYAKKSQELIPLCKRRLAEREFYVGTFYFKKKNYLGALKRFKIIIEQYPDSGLTDKALYFIGSSYLKLGEKELAKNAFIVLIKKFPRSNYAEDAKRKVKDIEGFKT